MNLLLQQLNGAITFTSAVGSGSRFTLRVPLSVTRRMPGQTSSSRLPGAPRTPSLAEGAEGGAATSTTPWSRHLPGAGPGRAASTAAAASLRTASPGQANKGPWQHFPLCASVPSGVAVNGGSRGDPIRKTLIVIASSRAAFCSSIPRVALAGLAGGLGDKGVRAVSASVAAASAFAAAALAPGGGAGSGTAGSLAAALRELVGSVSRKSLQLEDGGGGGSSTRGGGGGIGSTAIATSGAGGQDGPKSAVLAARVVVLVDADLFRKHLCGGAPPACSSKQARRAPPAATAHVSLHRV